MAEFFVSFRFVFFLFFSCWFVIVSLSMRFAHALISLRAIVIHHIVISYLELAA